LKVYLSGPITGDPLAVDKFKMAQVYVAKAFPEAQIFNPIDIPSPKFIQEDWENSDRAIWSYYMHEAIRMMMNCDTIVMLEGWSASKGAVIELDLAIKLNMNIYYIDMEANGTIYAF
jgi:hypothetical protein